MPRTGQGYNSTLFGRVLQQVVCHVRPSWPTRCASGTELTVVCVCGGGGGEEG
jgi:hypothetical protein